jgi:hypothetical protein
VGAAFYDLYNDSREFIKNLSEWENVDAGWGAGE